MGGLVMICDKESGYPSRMRDVVLDIARKRTSPPAGRGLGVTLSIIWRLI